MQLMKFQVVPEYSLFFLCKKIVCKFKGVFALHSCEENQEEKNIVFLIITLNLACMWGDPNPVSAYNLVIWKSVV